MHLGAPIFAQLFAPIHPQQFARIAARFPLRRASRSLSAWEHFLAMAFAQVTFRESLRDLVLCLDARPRLRPHLGFSQRVARSTLADANECRDRRVFAALAEYLMRQARRLYAGEPSGLADIESIYALDASIIDLSFALCPWANWTGRDAAVKLHTLLDLRGHIPAFVRITEAERYETAIFQELPLEAGSYYLMDRGYQDFATFYRMHQQGAFFVTRAKCNVRCTVNQSRPVDKTTGLRCDQSVFLANPAPRRLYPERLRRVRYFDHAQQLSLVFWTNQFALPALTIAELYRQRWQVELFFKWIKYNLRLRCFLGLSFNAVRIQLWSAICVYTLVAIAKKQWALPHSMHQILQVLSVAAFEQVPLADLFSRNIPAHPQPAPTNQLVFNNI
ncbi:MAG TPA: IS4 family transposase [Opitutaceae bacterium]|nr:IS4 family transposase [Opitutaceae bacterium]